MHACRKYSGRVGRSAAAKEMDPRAIRLASAAWVRHNKTDYDKLLAQGIQREAARQMIRQSVEQILAGWQQLKNIGQS